MNKRKTAGMEPMEEDFESWLGPALQIHLPALREDGFDNMETFALLVEEDLDELHVLKKGHRKLMLRKVQKLLRDNEELKHDYHPLLTQSDTQLFPPSLSLSSSSSLVRTKSPRSRFSHYITRTSSKGYIDENGEKASSLIHTNENGEKEEEKEDDECECEERRDRPERQTMMKLRGRFLERTTTQLLGEKVKLHAGQREMEVEKEEEEKEEKEEEEEKGYDFEEKEDPTDCDTIEDDDDEAEILTKLGGNKPNNDKRMDIPVVVNYDYNHEGVDDSEISEEVGEDEKEEEIVLQESIEIQSETERSVEERVRKRDELKMTGTFWVRARAREIPWDNTLPIYNKEVLPKLIILLVRHGESEANVDKSLYRRMADHAIPLSERGKKQAAVAGIKIKEFFQELHEEEKKGDNSEEENKENREGSSKYYCRLWSSSYKRARQTADIIVENAGEWISDQREDILIGEQQFGLFEGIDWGYCCSSSFFLVIIVVVVFYFVFSPYGVVFYIPPPSPPSFFLALPFSSL